MRVSIINIGLPLVSITFPTLATGCAGYEYSCVGRCYVANYFSAMRYGHLLLSNGTSINGWPINYTIPPNASIENAAPGPWGAFLTLQDTEDYYDGTQEIFAIVTWGQYGTGEYDYETSNIIDIGVDNDFVESDCGGPDD
ncbi:hypothetical protein BKA67DRAFT_542569 [Truncatella angustata]|uniref:Uncharacterized protein n=1 Tax=Truncatella angustata TaxID=152316 RepID=A0A9P8REL8_9PEZI|nr:uncharacterized protein BKA67DRAFT_542569 [Truncatella angustata]KAH6640044.1 hypothetical protein BKA67DRAFT_542569 [Truncatella angustata]